MLSLKQNLFISIHIHYCYAGTIVLMKNPIELVSQLDFLLKQTLNSLKDLFLKGKKSNDHILYHIT